MTRKLLLAATLLGSVSIAATASARPMTPEDVAKLEGVGAITVSPDGSRVAYTTNSTPDVTEGEDNGSTQSELNIAYGPNNSRMFLPKDVDPSNITFSPDGRMVSFTWKHDDDKYRAVWGIPVDGGTQVKLAEVGDANVRSHTWSPDSSTLYMLASAATDKQRDTQKKAGFNSVVYEEEAGWTRLFSAKVGDTVDKEPKEWEVPGYVSSFQVAPNGTTAIIETAPTPQVDDSYTSKRVNILDLITGEVSAVVETPGKIGDVEFSPDSSKLSLIAGIDMNDPAATTLHIVDVATGEFRRAEADPTDAAVDAEFLPNGDLATVFHAGASSYIQIGKPGGVATMTIPGGDLAITGIEAGGDKIVVRASTAEHPSELFSYDDGKFTRWTEHNPWLSEITFGEQSIVTYTARDGQEVEGILIKPVGGVPAGGAPLIMDVHGGPEAHESNGWLTNYGGPGQVAAGQGYAVFLPNYRGSTGYGVAFAKQHQGDYAGKEFNDIVDAKRHLVAEGIADADRVGITGGSYGGYATAWGATALSEEYAAAVMFVGISNQISKFGTGDIPYEMYNVHSLKWPWDDWQAMLEVSPIFHVDKAETPILIMHGEEDTRVDPGQSFELYRSIKIRKPDTPVRMVLYPGEGHGNRMAAARYDYNLRMMEWFDTYLKTGDRKAEMPGPRPQLAEGAKGAEASSDDEE
ncbi:S9 family peptidase [Pontixanthobacter aestiaquae]|uniref:Prolyl oligopeptidase family serine peptidase n=1 Tax=Pontixanthobacter aestiaquae TaxID=1509367 RepID=A0A844Z6Y5_9SPHN|nr:S9 family peptidase [Pontixanthobacter aestiaquae]MDN3646378.1 S9 family peptidase [Pontixanthobacter aestiaquae]MXO82633.1 prolyl oligopeptidase family serine peptidase [Pontixanthobacter aestiaquae]